MSEREYLYVIANDDMLDVIRSLKNDAAQAKQDFAAYVENLGGTVNYSKDDAEFTFANGVPAGWKVERSRAGEYIKPEWNSEAGRKMSIAFGKQDLQKVFNNACHAMAPTCHYNTYVYSFEELGDKTIIKCPPTHERDYLVPPGCTVLSYVDYVQLREAAQPTPQRVVKPFAKPFQQP